VLINKKMRLIILLTTSFFVYSDIICENILIIVNDQQPHLIATTFVFGFLVLQIIFASIQSALSDFLGRKKSLIFSLSVSLFSLICAYLYTNFHFHFGFLLILALVSKAIWGNTIPISFAAIADSQGKNYRRSFALASSTYSIAFITIILINFFSTRDFINILISTVFLLFSLFTCIFAFKDKSDKTAHLPYDIQHIENSRNFFSKFWMLGIREIGLLKKELRRPLTKYALSAYILWEISMYSVIISQIDLSNNSPQQITLAMMFAYLFGAFILQIRPFTKISDRKILKFAYILSFFSFLPYFVLVGFINSQNLLIGVCYTLHALGNAFLSPTILSILATGRSTHDQGKILGLAESSDTVAFLIATIFVMVYATYQLPISFLVIFSFVAFSTSWVYYSLIMKHEKLIKQF